MRGGLAFQGLEVNEVGIQDAFGYFAAFREDGEFFFIFREDVHEELYSFRGYCSGDGVSYGVVHVSELSKIG